LSWIYVGYAVRRVIWFSIGKARSARFITPTYKLVHYFEIY